MLHGSTRLDLAGIYLHVDWQLANNFHHLARYDFQNMIRIYIADNHFIPILDWNLAIYIHVYNT